MGKAKEIVTFGLTAAITGFFKLRKIQPNGFKWKQFWFELLVTVLGGIITANLLLGPFQSWLTSHKLMLFDSTPAAWWRIAAEYAAYFILFDTWFYWMHRAMHTKPLYRWVHKLHHTSTAPNVLTNFSVNPLEGFINGAFGPLFLTACTLAGFPVHMPSAALIIATLTILGPYVHSGYEFCPRWWNRSPLTRYFVTATFHDQHHRYFTGNFGAYTTIWDRICGTVRPNYEADFDRAKDRVLADSSNGRSVK